MEEKCYICIELFIIMKRNILPTLFLGILALMFFSCKKEKQTDVIITKIAPKPQVSYKPQQLSNFEYKKDIEWMGNTFTIIIHRYADKSLPMISNEDGRKFYDNKIDLKIIRKNGSTFFSRTFSKSDFKTYTSSKYAKHWILAGFMFDKVEGNYIKFGASIGDPDPNSDEFIPIDVAINNLGTVHITNVGQLDTDDYQHNSKTELEASEEEGI